MNLKERFEKLLKEVFLGVEIKGDSAIANLLSFKSKYYDDFITDFTEKIIKTKASQEIYDKLYDFFSSYFNESGSLFFANTPKWQKKYARISNKDVELFYKTKDLYYIKTQKIYDSLMIKVDEFNFKFNIDDLGKRKGNEKKEIEFFFTNFNKEKKLVEFKVKYKQNEDYSTLKKITGIDKPEKIRRYLFENRPEEIKYKKNYVFENLDKIKAKDIDLLIYTKEKDSLFEYIKVEFVLKDIEAIKKIANTNLKDKLENEIKEAFKIYKKQSSVDYFIHKNAKKFLQEQFDLYLFEYAKGEIFDEDRLKVLKELRDIAYELIDKISKFEDELKSIYLKPRIVFNSNYVITKDRLKKYEVLELFLKSDSIQEQIKEWKELKLVDDDFDISNINDDKYKFLPFDTKYFKDIEINLLESIENLDDELDGRLIHSENFQALNTILPKYRNQIDLIYIDPPFNTGSDFDYIDKFQDSTWLTLMENRIRLAYDLLNKKGSFYLHLDDNANIYGKSILNNFFNKITEIIFDTNATKDEESDLFGYKSFGNDFVLKHQTIFFAKNKNYKFNKLWKPNRNDTNLQLGQLDFIAKGNKYKPKKIEDFDFFIEIYENKNLIMKKIEINEKLFPIGDIWNDIYSFTQSEMRVSESLSFNSSQKPEHLLRRIIQSSTSQKDIILDFFAGIGTTAVASKKLNRKFLSIEVGEHFNNVYLSEDKFSHSSFEKLDKDAVLKIISQNKNEVKCLIKKLGILGRLKWVLFGDKNMILPDGRKRRPSLSKDINWQGGGFFKYYSLEQYEDILQQAKYTDDLETSSKLTFAIEIEGEEAQINLNKIYPDKNIDIAETMSNLLGRKIIKITKNKVILEDLEIDLNNFTFENYSEIKKLIYWG